MISLAGIAIMRSYNTNLGTVFGKIGNQLTNDIA
jgi:Flp pilus assembly pilin Flp